MSFDKIIYKLTDQRIPAATGIGLVGDILYNAGFQKQLSNIRNAEKRSRKQIDCGTVLTSFIGLLCRGKPDFDAVSESQNDAAYYQTALRLKTDFRQLQHFVKEWTRSENRCAINFSCSTLIF